jgi:exonuclease VII large subunit
VTAAINAAQAGMTGAYVKGIICKAPESVNTKYGSCTYFISADGKTTSDQLQVYSGLFLQKEQFTSKDQLKVGDEVIVVGDLKMYNGAPEIDKNNWIVSLNGKTSVGGEEPAGTAKNPFTVAQAFAYIDGGGADNVYVKGKVSKVVYTFDASHKTGTFWISEDGTFNNDLTKDFEAYSVYWLGNKEWADGMGQVAVGDEVVLCGKITKYTDKNKGTITYETSSKKAYVYSINGKTE